MVSLVFLCGRRQVRGLWGDRVARGRNPGSSVGFRVEGLGFRV